MPTTYEGVGNDGHYTFAQRIFYKIKSWIDAQGFMTDVGLIDKIYPVGSIYMSVNNVNPSTIFGGTWEAWGSGRVPVGVNTSDTDFSTVEKTGGAKSHNYTPAGTNKNMGVTMNAVTLSHSGGSVHNTTLTFNHLPNRTATVIYATSAKYVSGIAWGALTTKANSYYLSDIYDAHSAGFISEEGGKAHNHGFTQPNQHSFTPSAKSYTNPTFTGTQASMNHLQPYITCYMWKRVA